MVVHQVRGHQEFLLKVLEVEVVTEDSALPEVFRVAEPIVLMSKYPLEAVEVLEVAEVL